MAEDEVKATDIEEKRVEGVESKEAEDPEVSTEDRKDTNDTAAGEEEKDRVEENGEDQAGKEDEVKDASKEDGEDHESKSDRHDRSDPKRQNGYRPRHVDYRDNIKFDPSVREESDDPEEIRKQVEFYFSDANVVRDKFLFNQIGGSENRSIPISVIHSFKRMRRFQPLSAVIAALKESEVLEVVKEDEIQRKVPLSQEIGTNFEDVDLTIIEDEAMPRTLYAKGFGKEKASTQYDIENFFEPYGPIKAVRLRRNDQKFFKGSVFVEFEDQETMKAFLELDPKPKWNDDELKIMSKKEYCEMKVEDIKSGRIEPNNNRFRKDDRRRDDRYGGGRRGSYKPYRKDYDRRRSGPSRYRDEDDRDEDDWKGRRDDFQRRGYRDRDDRRKDRRSRKDEDEEEDEQEYHDNGIPKVKTTSPPPEKHDREEEDEEPEAMKSKPEPEDEEKPSTKRAREEDDAEAAAEAEEPESKKSKPEITAQS